MLFLIHNGAKMNGTYLPLIVTPSSFATSFPFELAQKEVRGIFQGAQIFSEDCVLSKTIYFLFPNLIKVGIR